MLSSSFHFCLSSDRKKQCSVMLDLLKKFQGCRSHLSNSMQRAEQTISEQASYMGKDYLQRTITKVGMPKCHNTLKQCSYLHLTRTYRQMCVHCLYTVDVKSLNIYGFLCRSTILRKSWPVLGSVWKRRGVFVGSSSPN